MEDEPEHSGIVFHTVYDAHMAVNYSWWRLSSFEIWPIGWAVSHGSEEDLPQVEARIQVCYGKGILCFDDNGPLWLHRGWLWMVSLLFFNSILWQLQKASPCFYSMFSPIYCVLTCTPKSCQVDWLKIGTFSRQTRATPSNVITHILYIIRSIAECIIVCMYKHYFRNLLACASTPF